MPEHWNANRLKDNLRLFTEKTSRRENPIGLENIEGWTGRFIHTDTEFEGEGSGFASGDILPRRATLTLERYARIEKLAGEIGQAAAARKLQISRQRVHQCLIKLARMRLEENATPP